MNIQRVIVVEVYDYTAGQVAVTAMCRSCGDFFFALLPSFPLVNFNDLLEVEEYTDYSNLYLFRGNGRLRYRLHLLEMPDSLFRNLIESRT